MKKLNRKSASSLLLRRPAPVPYFHPFCFTFQILPLPPGKVIKIYSILLKKGPNYGKPYHWTKEQLLDSHQRLNESDKSSFRNVMSQLNWLSNISRLEISIQVSSISSKIRNATISDIKAANKIIKFIKDNKTHIIFPPLNIPSTKLVVYSDVSFNISDDCSQGGYLVFLAHVPSPGSLTS